MKPRDEYNSCKLYRLVSKKVFSAAKKNYTYGKYADQ